ncbi:MAG: hypothetical protein GYB66_09195 [Chloroflexi bacterium]|nr:hypothetical protein [Chloroflexota bacterium]
MPNTTLWQLTHPEMQLFRYHGAEEHQAKSCVPVLMVHSTLASHRSWEALAGQFWEAGVGDIYAIDVAEIQMGLPMDGGFDLLSRAIGFILGESETLYEALAVVAHGAGAVVAYRYWQAFEAEAGLSHLFLLGAPHHGTVFPLMRETTVSGDAMPAFDGLVAHQNSASTFTKIESVQGQSSTVIVNFIGNQAGPDFDAVVRGLGSSTDRDGIISHAVGPNYDGLVQGLHLPEAVNLIVPLPPPLDHRDINKDHRVGDAILACLRGERYQLRLHLVGIRLRGEDVDGYSGPVAFEINGIRMPPDSIFHGVTDRLYLFDEHVPPICTLGYPSSAISGTITLHLKDLSNERRRRRRMYARLHIPLRTPDDAIHAMQDSEGSDFLWRVVSERMPVVLKDPSTPPEPEVLSRGI